MIKRGGTECVKKGGKTDAPSKVHWLSLGPALQPIFPAVQLNESTLKLVR